MYMSQREHRKIQDPYLPTGFPPSSPFTISLLPKRKRRQIIASKVNKMTLKPKAPAG